MEALTPQLHARDEEEARLRKQLEERDEQLVSQREQLQAREEEVTGLQEQLQASAGTAHAKVAEVQERLGQVQERLAQVGGMGCERVIWGGGRKVVATLFPGKPASGYCGICTPHPREVGQDGQDARFWGFQGLEGRQELLPRVGKIHDWRWGLAGGGSSPSAA